MFTRIVVVLAAQCLLSACTAYKVTVIDMGDPASAAIQRQKDIADIRLSEDSGLAFNVQAACGEKTVHTYSLDGAARKAIVNKLADTSKLFNPAPLNAAQTMSEHLFDQLCERDLLLLAKQTLNQSVDSSYAQSANHAQVEFLYDRKVMARNNLKAIGGRFLHWLTLTTYPAKTTAVHEMRLVVHSPSGAELYDDNVIVRTDYYWSGLLPVPVFMSWLKNYKYDWDAYIRTVTLNETISTLMARGNKLALHGGLAHHIRKINESGALGSGRAAAPGTNPRIGTAR